ncbi:hypothetical protein PYW07_011494 [Mythimna separata]|uniref:Endonuclease/exonuclease/phosphatase domain-containing protein n=1 Tax=Mythimna separata TaxID=271217 RepID=A0AAD8DLA2_MYTSE|nr:hypothetical protein PYW07_011494 [Mythimna separata]
MDIKVQEIFNCNSANHFFQQIPPKTSIHLSCIHFNIRSLIKNFTKLQQITHTGNSPLDLIILTEVGISDSIVNLYNLPGYKLYSQLRSSRKGGGIIMYVRNHIKFTLIEHKTKTFENLTGYLKIDSHNNAIVSAIYRPPSTNKSVFVSELANHIAKFDLKQNLLLIGDTNINLKESPAYKDSYLRTLSEHGLLCGITDYTRIETKKDLITKSCIDHIFARFPTLQPFAAVLDVVLADHRGIIFTCGEELFRGPKCIQGVQKKTINYDIFYKELKSVDWTKTTSMDSPNDILSFIYKAFDNADKSASNIKASQLPGRYSKHFTIPWIDNNITRLCDKRDKLYSDWKNNLSNSKIKLEYNKIRNKIHKILENRRNNYYMQYISDNFKNLKKMYTILNQMLGKVTLSFDTAILRAFDAQGVTTKTIADNFTNNSVYLLITSINYE